MLGDEVFESLLTHDWPGNIRELKNCLEYTVAHSGEIVGIQDLPDYMIKSKVKDDSDNDYEPTSSPVLHQLNFNQAKERFEKKFLERQLDSNDGKINQTARVLEMSKSTLIAKIRNYDINTHEIKSKKFKNRPGALSEAMLA